MQQAASMFGADVQAKGMGLWDVGAVWGEDQSLQLLQTHFTIIFSVILAILL